MSVTSGGTAQLVLGSGLRRDSGGFLDVEPTAFTPPGPDGTFQIRGVDDDAEEAVLAGGIMRRPHLQRHLVIGTEVDRLHMATIA